MGMLSSDVICHLIDNNEAVRLVRCRHPVLHMGGQDGKERLGPLLWHLKNEYRTGDDIEMRLRAFGEDRMIKSQ